MYIDSSNLNKEVKKLKRYPKAQDTLEKIIKHIKFCKNYEELKNNPMSKVYGFEELKYELNGFSSFELDKLQGIRLIVQVIIEENTIIVKFISLEHYEDFKRYLKKSKK